MPLHHAPRRMARPLLVAGLLWHFVSIPAPAAEACEWVLERAATLRRAVSRAQSQITVAAFNDYCTAVHLDGEALDKINLALNAYIDLHLNE